MATWHDCFMEETSFSFKNCFSVVCRIETHIDHRTAYKMIFSLPFVLWLIESVYNRNDIARHTAAKKVSRSRRTSNAWACTSFSTHSPSRQGHYTRSFEGENRLSGNCEYTFRLATGNWQRTSFRRVVGQEGIYHIAASGDNREFSPFE